MIDFVIHPNSGFLNTTFGVKVTKGPPNIRYKFKFSDDTSTNWISSRAFVYYRFKEAGLKYVTLKFENGETIAKTISISNTLHYGSGKTKSIEIATKSKKVIFIKSTGLNIYNIVTKQEYFIAITPDKIIELSKNRAMIVSKDKIGIMNLSTGEIFNQFDGLIRGYSTQKKIAIVSNGNSFKIIRFYNDNPIVTEIEGVSQCIDFENLRFIYSDKDEFLHCYYIGKYKHKNIGKYKFNELSGLKNEFILCENEYRKIVWDVKKFEEVFSYDKGQEFIALAKDRFIGYYANWGIKKKDSSINSIYGNTLNYKIKVFTNRKYSKVVFVHPNIGYQILDYNFEELNHTLIKTDGKFIQWLGDGRFFQILHDETNRIHSTRTSEEILQCKGSIMECIYFSNTWILVTNIGSQAKFYNLKTGKLIFYIEGYYHKKHSKYLKQYKQLWIANTKYSSEYQVYDGLSFSLIKAFTLIDETNNYILTDDRILSKRNLVTLKKYDSGISTPLYNKDLSIIINKHKDGYYVLFNGLKRKQSKYFLIQEPDKIYKSSDIHPNKNIAVLSSNRLSEIIDLDTFEVIKTLKTNFIKFDISGNIYCSDQMKNYWGYPRIFDPDTFEEIEPANLHKYKFVSRDGKYGISLQYKSKYQLIKLETNELMYEIKNENPTLDWSNFIDFHPTKNIIVVSGKIAWSSGVTKILKFDDSANKSYCRIAECFVSNKANWNSKFSNCGTFIAYFDSNPITYIYRVSGYGKIYPHNVIKGRSFKCFSPNGNRIVLSDNRYVALTSGGTGWSESTKLWIINTRSGKELKSFEDHNTDIRYANFSEDGSKLVSRSMDGVVVIRKL